MKNLILFVILLFWTLLLLPQRSSAHLPLFKTGDIEERSRAQKISEPEIASMIFGRISPEKIDFYKFEIAASFNLHAEIIVPRSSKYAAFRPSLAVIGPGLKKSDEPPPFELEEGMGAIVLDDGQKNPRETFFDFETLSRYWQGPKIRQYLVEPGTYWLAVFEPDNRPGAYALRLSDKEKWGLSEIFNRIKGLFKVKFGLY